MKNSTLFFSSIKNDCIAFALFLLFWAVGALFFPEYVIPSPLKVASESATLVGGDFLSHLNLTVYRTIAGFLIALFGGMFVGIVSSLLNIRESATMVLVLFQVIPGAILGVIFLLIFGVGSGVPIALVAALTMPVISVNTANALLKKEDRLELYIRSVGGGTREIVTDLFFPALIPVFKTNLTVGMSLALKVVVLGEFIGSQDGIGYLINVARIYFSMNEVFFDLTVILLMMIIFEMIISGFFAFMLAKYLYPE
ncbi:MAG: ABC transporter permease subunit [Chitinivibrionales bacterium]|nr:ABC transporter permease subunit [Chitinivibrionales bacterium]